MSIKVKIVLSIVLIVSVTTLTLEWAARHLLLSRFSTIERSNAFDNFARFRNAIDAEIERVDAVCHDWASWDDAYEFLKKPSEQFIATNLPENVYKINQLNLIVYVDPEGRIAFSGARDILRDEEVVFSEFTSERIDPTHPIFRAFQGDPPGLPLKGVLRTSRGPLLFAARTVLPSIDKGEPNGFLVMGKWIDSEMVLPLSKRVGLRCEILDGSAMPASTGLPENPGLTFRSALYIQNTDFVQVMDTYRDIEGAPAFVMSVFSNRDFYRKGLEMVQYLRWIILALGVFSLLSLFLLIQWTTIHPCNMLTAHARHIYDTGDLKARLPENRKDEFGQLSRIFNAMMENIVQLIGRVKHSEALYRTVSDHSVALITLIQRSRIRYANPALLRCTGYGEDELIGTDPLELIHPDERPVLEETMKQAKMNESWSGNVRLITKEGETRRIEMVASVVRWGDEPAILAHGIDVTDKVAIQQKNLELEDKIRQAERMETLGILAGGVAHDLNNILNGIIGIPEILMMQMPPEDPVQKHLQMIRDSGKRAAAFVEDLLTIGRGSKARHIELSLNAVIREYLESAELKHLLNLHPQAVIKTDLHPDLHLIFGSPLHIGKVVMNLVANAVEALKGVGVVLIRTENILLDRPIAGYEAVRKGMYCRLTVSDTGIGMDKTDVERIFEPFFSKKTLGKSGTGLGMTIVWNAVADHDGYIEVESYPEQGTTFHLYFPARIRNDIS